MNRSRNLGCLLTRLIEGATTLNKLVTFALSTLVSLTLSAAHVQATVIDWFDFTGWDHALVTGPGQAFTNIHGGVDVTVTGTPGNSVISSFDGDIRTGGNHDTHSFTFSFSQPLDLILDVKSIDLYETLTTTSSSPISYTHSLGAAPTQTGTLTIHGNGVGFGANGAARGQQSLGMTSSVVWTYTAHRAEKYERFRLGVAVVPEPGACGLLVGMLLLPLRGRIHGR